MRSIKELMGLEEADKMKDEDPCWANYEMIGTKPGKDGRPVPNCVLKKPKKAKSKNEEVEIAEAKVGDTVSFHHELKSAPGSKVKKSGTVEKVDGDVVHVKVKDKYGVKRHQIKMGDLVKEDTELEEASDTKRPPNFTMHPIDRQDYKILRPPKKTPPKGSKEWGRDGGEKKIKEETEQIDELNKDTLYSYSKKADADVEKKHKSLGQLMRKGDAAGANKAAHQLNKRVAGMERAEKRLNSEEVEMDEGMLDAVKGAAKSVSKRVADSAKSTAVGFVHGAIDSATSHSSILRHAGNKLHKAVKKKFGEELELEASHKRSLDLKTTVLEAVKSMKKKEVTKDIDVKKGEKLSGKQETVKMNPALYEK